MNRKIHRGRDASREIEEYKDGLKRRTAEVLDKALRSYENKLMSESLKPALAEYLKLLELEKELAEEVDGPQEMKVTWVEPEVVYIEE